MAKKQMPKKQPSNVNKKVDKFWQKNWAALLLVIVLLGVLAFIGVNRLIIYNQKKQFDQAEKSLDTLYADIVKNVGQPTDMKKDKSCGYQSTVWGNGDRACGTSYSLSYVADAESGNNYSEKISETLHNLPYVKLTFERKGLFKNGSNSEPLSEPAFDIKMDSVKSKTCTASIHYYDKDYNSYPKISNSYISVNFGCSGNAKAEFYPVKN